MWVLDLLYVYGCVASRVEFAVVAFGLGNWGCLTYDDLLGFGGWVWAFCYRLVYDSFDFGFGFHLMGVFGTVLL